MTNDIGRPIWRRVRLRCGMLLAMCLLLVLVAVPAGAAEAREYAVGDVPNVRLQDARRYVSDPSAILSATARDTIDAVLGRLERSTGIETAVVMLPSIGESDIFDFAHELFRTWGIGKKKSDNGLLIVFVMDQRKVRFTTGYGLEGTMTDAMARRIQTTAMVPRFREADWDGGMVAGVRAAARVLDGSMRAEADGGDDDIALGAIVALLAIIGVTVLFIAVAGEQQRCPKCRRRGALRKVSSERIRLATASGRPGRRIVRTTYVCKHCGHIVHKDTPDDDGSGLANAAMLGSMLGSGRRGGGFGGGGSFGGSFGGGSTGGGGATSGW